MYLSYVISGFCLTANFLALSLFTISLHRHQQKAQLRVEVSIILFQTLTWLFPCFIGQKYGEKDTHVILPKSRDALVPLLAKRRQRGSYNQRWGTYRVMAVVASVTVACAGVCLVLQHPNEVIQMSTSLRRCLWGQWYSCIFQGFSALPAFPCKTVLFLLKYIWWHLIEASWCVWARQLQQ